jgi:hypothetical protein
MLVLVTTSTCPWPELIGEASAGQYARMHPSCWPAWLPSSRLSLLLLPWLLGLQHKGSNTATNRRKDAVQ